MSSSYSMQSYRELAQWSHVIVSETSDLVRIAAVNRKGNQNEVK